MKKFEYYFGILTVISIILNLLNVPLSAILSIYVILCLSTMYFYLGFALFNGIYLRGIFKKELYKGVSLQRTLVAIVTGIALSFMLIGTLFQMHSWPYAYFTFSFGASLAGVILIVGLFKYSKTKSNYYLEIFKRILFYALLGFIVYFIA